jgi:chorismate mutase
VAAASAPRYRHTIPQMAARVVHALDQRLTLALQVAEAITPAELDRTDRVF